MNQTKELADLNRQYSSLKSDEDSLFLELRCLEMNRGCTDNRQKSHRSMLQGPLQRNLVLYYSSDSGARK